jgi:hypothetical protein
MASLTKVTETRRKAKYKKKIANKQRRLKKELSSKVTIKSLSKAK